MIAQPIPELACLDLDTPGMRRGLLHRDGLPIAMHLEHRANAVALIVTMSNLCARSVATPPSFETLDWAQRKDWHLLSISDPMLMLDDTLEVSAFIGTRERDPIPPICTIVEEAAALLGMQRVILWGLSGGAFGAIKVAARTGFEAVAINAQLDLWDLRHWQVLKAVARVFGADSVSDMCAAAPDRTSCARDLAAMSNRIIWVQNEIDDTHLLRHFQPACVIGRGMPTFTSFTYRSPEGHAPPPDVICNQMLNMALADGASRSVTA